MTAGVRYSRAAAARLAAALALLVLVVLGRALLLRTWRQQARATQGEAAALAAEITARRDFGPAQLQALQLRVRQARLAAAGADAWSRLEQRLAAHWQPEAAESSAPAGDRGPLGRRTFLYPRAVPGDWPEILAAIQDVESLPGLAIEAVELAIAPDAGARRFAVVRLRVVGRLPSSEPNLPHHE